MMQTAYDAEREPVQRRALDDGAAAGAALPMRAAQARAAHAQSRAVLAAAGGGAAGPAAERTGRGAGGGQHAGPETGQQVGPNTQPLGVFSAYVPLSLLPDSVESGQIADHAFIEFDDGWSAGFTKLDGESASDARIHIPEPRRGDSRKTRHLARRKADATSQSKTPAEIKDAIRIYAQRSPGRYNLITNNCGDWVKRAFDACHLVPETPGRVY